MDAYVLTSSLELVFYVLLEPDLENFKRYFASV